MLPPLLDTFFGLAAGGVLPARAEGASQAGVPGEVNRGAAVQAASPATAAVPGSEVAKEQKRAPRASVRSPLQKGGSNFSLVNHGGVGRYSYHMHEEGGSNLNTLDSYQHALPFTSLLLLPFIPLLPFTLLLPLLSLRLPVVHAQP